MTTTTTTTQPDTPAPVPTTEPNRRLAPDTRQADLLTIALTIARNEGFHAVTRKRVAQAARVSPGLVTFRFLSTDLMREAVMTEAVRIGDLSIVADGIALRNPLALAAPLEMRMAALEQALEQVVE